MSTTRRDFIRFVVAGSITAGCPIDLSLLAANLQPIVGGDNYETCHEVRDGHRFDRPSASKKYDVVVVGGGVSGLTCAYLLRDQNFLLLEKEPHWGGNSCQEDYKGMPFANGGAFLDEEAGFELAAKLGLQQLPIDNWDGSIIHGEFIPDTWGDGIDHLPYPQSVRESFTKFRDSLLQIDAEKRATELYNVPFSQFTRGYAPEVKLWWNTYGPSNWGAAVDDTAAKVAIDDMQFIAGANRKDIRRTFSGGLGAITKQLAERMQPHSDRILLNATTVAVAPQKHDVNVTFLQAGKLQTVSAKGVIMATPKFITARIVEGMPQKQREAIAQIQYIPYAVVNLIYDRPVFNLGYDTWCPGNTFCDVVVADWVVRSQAGYRQKYNILTCYTPLPRQQRYALLTDEGCRQIAADVLRDFQKLLPSTNIDPVEVHIYSRGHPVFMSMPGNYTQVLPVARQAMERVFFANTDSEGPISTTPGGIAAARRAVSNIAGWQLAGLPPLQRALAPGTRSSHLVNSGSPCRQIPLEVPATALFGEAAAAIAPTVSASSTDATTDLLLDIANRKIESQHEVIAALDQKCSVLLGFSLISVIEMLGFLLLVAVEQPTNGTHEPTWVHLAFHLAMILVVAGSVILLLSLRGIAYHAISAPEFCGLCDVTKDYREVATSVLANSGRAMTRNFLVIRHRRIRIRIAAIVIGVGLFLFAVLATRMFETHF